MIFLLLSIFLFPRHSCCFRPQSLTYLLRFTCAQPPFPNFRPLGAPCTILSLVHLFRGFLDPTVCHCPLHWSFCVPVISTAASSLRTSRCFATVIGLHISYTGLQPFFPGIHVGYHLSLVGFHLLYSAVHVDLVGSHFSLHLFMQFFHFS